MTNAIPLKASPHLPPPAAVPLGREAGRGVQHNRPVTWGPELEELRRREEQARQLGGAERVARQHAAGRSTVRERLDLLLDPGSFEEYGALAGRATYEDGRLVEFRPSNI